MSAVGHEPTTQRVRGGSGLRSKAVVGECRPSRLLCAGRRHDPLCASIQM